MLTITECDERVGRGAPNIPEASHLRGYRLHPIAYTDKPCTLNQISNPMAYYSRYIKKYVVKHGIDSKNAE